MTFRSLLFQPRDGDPAPSADAGRRADGRPAQPDPAAIEAEITERTRAVVTVSPNNPTGAVYPEETLAAIHRLCGERGIYHISDEAYEYFTYDGARHFSPGSLGGEHSISLYSFSKSYGMASWRVGVLVAPEHLYDDLMKIPGNRGRVARPQFRSSWRCIRSRKGGGTALRTLRLPGSANCCSNRLEEIHGLCVLPPPWCF